MSASEWLKRANQKLGKGFMAQAVIDIPFRKILVKPEQQGVSRLIKVETPRCIHLFLNHIRSGQCVSLVGLAQCFGIYFPGERSDVLNPIKPIVTPIHSSLTACSLILCITTGWKFPPSTEIGRTLGVIHTHGINDRGANGI